MTSLPDPRAVRMAVERGRLMLLFSPDLCSPRAPLEVLEAVLPQVDIIQVRPKPLGRRGSSEAPGEAGSSYEWCVRILALRAVRERGLPVIVNDRVDVALALRAAGCAGVHLGQTDCPIAIARERLGPDALIGLSTHDLQQVVLALESDVDYLGFGPVHATRTKGYAQGLGSELAWIASAAAHVPLFPIGGIDAANADELARIGRAAVGSAILSADDPERAACELRHLLQGSSSNIASP